MQKAIRDEKFKFNRRAHGEGDNRHSEFQSEISEVQQLREKLADLKIERNTLRDNLHKAIEEAKANVFPFPRRMKRLRSTVVLCKAVGRTFPRSWTDCSIVF